MAKTALEWTGGMPLDHRVRSSDHIAPETHTEMHTKKADLVSHLLVAILILGVMVLKLTSGAIAGFLVYSLRRRITGALERRYPRMPARGVALGLVVASVALAVLVALLGLWQFAKSQHGIAELSSMIVDVLGKMHATVPAALQGYLPASIEEARTVALGMLRKYSEQLSAVGMGTLRGAAHVLIGLIAGAMLAWKTSAPHEDYRPLSRALLARFSSLCDAFERVVFAQVKVSLLNTALSALYLQIALPIAGVHVPFSKTLVALTFFAGLIPVVGNLLSNVAIVVASLGVSFNAAVASLAYLVAIHKLEYFVNARIVGHKIQARAWEIVIVMVGMEAIFGLRGIVVAPILYAYVKKELKTAGLIGRTSDATEPAQAERESVSSMVKRRFLTDVQVGQK